MIPAEIEAVALLGWCVFPASNYSRAACFEGAHDAATSDLDTIAKWCSEYPNCNWRIVFQPSGLIGFDCDVPPGHVHDGVAAMAALVQQHGPLPPRPTMRSGGGGMVILFKDTGVPIRGASGAPAPGIDPRRGRQSQTVPPSRHHRTGQPYRWLADPWHVSAPPAPQWLLDLVKPLPEPELKPAAKLETSERARNYAVAWLYNAVRRVASAPEGSRNDLLNRECFALAKHVSTGTLTEGEIRDALAAAARAAGLPVREALLTIDSGLKSRRK